MGLINLLSVGRSLIGVSHGTGHYKLAQGNLLPNFGGARPTGGVAGAPAGGSVGKAAERAVVGSKSAAPARGTGQGELKLEAPPAVKLAVTASPKAATATVAAVSAVTVVSAVTSSPATAAVAETKTAPATAATTPAAPTPARPRAEEKFTLGRWVSLMLNR